MTNCGLPIILGLLFFTFNQSVSAQNGDVQPEKPKKSAVVLVKTQEDAEFYTVGFLESDLKESDVVAHVNVLSYELADQIGMGGCEQNKGAGYCLYLLKAEVREIFKGKIATRKFEFYKVTEADYAHKEKMIGSHVVFLKWSNDFPGKKRSLGTIENSTRDIKHNVIAKLRKISRRKK